MAESRAEAEAAAADQPLELILARNLVSIISLAAFLFDAEGRLVFYNDAAAEFIGRQFEEVGVLTRKPVQAELRPLDPPGRDTPAFHGPAAMTVNGRLAAYSRVSNNPDHSVKRSNAGAL